ncbi:MAG: GNAT family N-acetyltransferase, partial [Acidobacteriota bacterium]
MLDANFTFINEEVLADRITPQQLDHLLAAGWRHFGTHFFRYNLGVYESDIRRVIPLRVRLARYSPSKSQRRVLRQNEDVSTVIRPLEITDEAEALFEKHKHRFRAGVPDSIDDFVSRHSELMPCEALQLDVRIGERLIAASYFDVGHRSVSAIYGMFDPEFSARSLGNYTMLKEIDFAVENKKEFYYQGYSYEGESFYDYKKRFRGTEG